MIQSVEFVIGQLDSDAKSKMKNKRGNKQFDQFD